MKRKYHKDKTAQINIRVESHLLELLRENDIDISHTCRKALVEKLRDVLNNRL